MSEGKMPDEYEVYVAKLPKSEQAQLSDEDKVALGTFSVAATALFGPVGGALVAWWVTGGANWVGNFIMSLLPSSWKASGTFPWIEGCIDPVRSQAIKRDILIMKATQNAYRLLLNQKGMVHKNDNTPFDLQWKQFRHKIDPLAAKSDSFSTHVLEKAQQLGYDDFYDIMIKRPGGQSFLKLHSWDQCLKKGGSPLNLNYCVTLQGIPSVPEKDVVIAIADGMARAFDAYRLEPLRLGYRNALAEAARALNTERATNPSRYTLPDTSPTAPRPPLIVPKGGFHVPGSTIRSGTARRPQTSPRMAASSSRAVVALTFAAATLGTSSYFLWRH